VTPTRARLNAALRADPTRTGSLRRALCSHLSRQFALLKGDVAALLVKEGAFGATLNTRWATLSRPDQLARFTDWLRGRFGARLRNATEEQLWAEYVRKGFQQGAGRAFDDVQRGRGRMPRDRRQFDELTGERAQTLRSAFGRPVSVERVQLIASRAYSELQNVTEDTANKMARSLADSMVTGKGPREAARDLARLTDLGADRALLVARTEIVRAHAEGQLTALEEMGVEEVGVAVEWVVTQDARTCRACSDLEGVVLKLEEARGMLPRHPGCRCAWVPANVGESKDQQGGQKTTRKRIVDAIRSSQESQGDTADEWGPGDEVSKARPTDVRNAANPPPMPPTPESLELGRYLTTNGWVTLPSGQHVFLGDDGLIRPAGPGTAPIRAGKKQLEEARKAPAKQGPAKTPMPNPQPVAAPAYPPLETTPTGTAKLPRRDSPAVKAVPKEDVAALIKTAREVGGRDGVAAIHKVAERLGWDKPKLAHVAAAALGQGLGLRVQEGYDGLSQAEQEWRFDSYGERMGSLSYNADHEEGSR